jgi:acetoin utilization deacetylase AcuC-like enzyme
MESKSREFFKSAKPSHHDATCRIQIISEQDIQGTLDMPAGESEDQSRRLFNMTNKLQAIKEKHFALPLMTTDEVKIPEYWEKLFLAIDHNDKKEALELLKNIPGTDMILQAILTTHPMDYVQKLVNCSIDALTMGEVALPTEITITPKTLEILVKDLATTLLLPAKVHFSFGLPTHHAFAEGGSGFCIFDKTAMLIKYKAQTSSAPLKFMIIGTDINRDNGLSNDLMNTASQLNICHVDIFDSRVYPNDDHQDIAFEFNDKGHDAEQEVKFWTRDNITYFAVDLSLTPRGKGSMHAALEFALKKTKEQIAQAKHSGQQIMLVLPTGWDSHQNETAPCGKFVNGRRMSKAEAEMKRFSDNDLTHFYEQLFDLYNANKETIIHIYWGLEGGYNRSMYEHQIELLMNIVVDKLINRQAHGMTSRP